MKCKQCGTDDLNDSSTCKKCGASLKAVEENDDNEDTNNDLWIYMLITIIGMAGAIIFKIYWCWLICTVAVFAGKIKHPKNAFFSILFILLLVIIISAVFFMLLLDSINIWS